MKSFQEIRDLLGLGGRTLGRVEEIRLRREQGDVARGFVAKEQALASFLLEEEALFLECGAAEEMGFELANFEDWPEMVRVYTPGRGFRALLTAALPGVHERSEEEAFFVDFRQYAAPLAIVDDRGEGLLLRYQEGVLEVSQILDLRDVPAPQIVLNSDLETWVKETGDDWLIGEVSQLCGLSLGMSHWIAVGIYLRLEEMQNAQERAARVRNLLSGELPEKERRVREWVRGLPQSTVEALQRVAYAEVEDLREALLGVEADFMTGEEIEESHIRALCRRRDELAGVGLLLSYHAGDAEEWDLSLGKLDEIGEGLIKDLRRDGLHFEEDEYLRRASFVRASDWWTALVGSDLEENEF